MSWREKNDTSVETNRLPLPSPHFHPLLLSLPTSCSFFLTSTGRRGVKGTVSFTPEYIEEKLELSLTYYGVLSQILRKNVLP